MVAAGALQIILFFKLWQMTDDVTKIKKQLEEQKATVGKEDIIAATITGDIDTAYKRIVDDTVTQLIDARKQYKYQQALFKEYNQAENKNMMEEAHGQGVKIIDRASRKCAALDRELPAQLKSFDTYLDYTNDLIQKYLKGEE